MTRTLNRDQVEAILYRESSVIDPDDVPKLLAVLDREAQSTYPRTHVYRSDIDAAAVVHIDTDPAGECDEIGPRPLRVYINDGNAVYENPPLPAGEQKAIAPGGCRL